MEIAFLVGGLFVVLVLGAYGTFMVAYFAYLFGRAAGEAEGLQTWPERPQRSDE